jgi:feruloyl esterase
MGIAARINSVRLYRRAGRFGLGAAALAAAPFVGATSAAAATPCETMGNGSRFGNATVVFAQEVPAGDYSGQDGTKIAGLPAFCRIFAVASPHPSSRILIEVWMPAVDKWNGKLLGTGNGGAAGKISPGSLAGGLRRGYASVTTDLGSYPAGQPGVGFNFGDGRPEAVRDWAFRATHEMTVLAKDVVLRYYGRSASKSYFVGCSTGGHQALSEAQKYPDDYDGIIAGAPAHNRTRLHIRFAALRQLGMQQGAAIPSPLLAAWQQSILKACGGRDGGAPGDKFLTNPLQCTISPRQLACRKGESGDSCLSATQVGALEKIYSGTRNPRTGELIYFGDVPGSETQLMAVYGDTPLSRDFNITHWTLPPDRPSASFDFDRDMKTMDDSLAVEVNAMDTDLSRFAARGGKLIIHHGWADGLITATDSLDYYQRLHAVGEDKASFARLFMVPGMGHCAGGGIGFFGQAAELPQDKDATPETDLLLALDRWSETGDAPDVIFGRQSLLPVPVKPGDEGRRIGQRPICAFPRVARYDGKGNPDAAASFTCVKAPAPKYERPAAAYLR